MSRTTRSQYLSYIQTVIPATVAHNATPPELYVSSRAELDRSFRAQYRPGHSELDTYHHRPIQINRNALPTQVSMNSPYMWLVPDNSSELTLVRPSIPKRRRTSVTTSDLLHDEFRPLHEERFCIRDDSDYTERVDYIRFVHPHSRAEGVTSDFNHSCGLHHSQPVACSLSTTRSDMSCSASSFRHSPASYANRRKRPSCFLTRSKNRPYATPGDSAYHNLYRRRMHHTPRSCSRKFQLLTSNMSTSVSRRSYYDPSMVPTSIDNGSVRAALRVTHSPPLSEVMTSLSNEARSICSDMLESCPRLVTSIHELFDRRSSGQATDSNSVSIVLGSGEISTDSDCAGRVNTTKHSVEGTGKVDSQSTTNRGVFDSVVSSPLPSSTGESVSPVRDSNPFDPESTENAESEAVVAAVASAAEAVANAVSAVVSHHRRLSSGSFRERDLPADQNHPIPLGLVDTFSRISDTIDHTSSAQSAPITSTVGEHSVTQHDIPLHPSNSSRLSFPQQYTARNAVASERNCFANDLFHNTPLMGLPSVCAAVYEPMAIPPPTDFNSRHSRSLVNSMSFGTPCTTAHRISLEHPSVVPLTVVPSANMLSNQPSFGTSAPSIHYPSFVSVAGPSQASFVPLATQFAGTISVGPVAPLRVSSRANANHMLRTMSLAHSGSTQPPVFNTPFSFPAQMAAAASILPVHNLVPVSYADAYSATRDAQTLFQFLRVMNQRPEAYSLPYYPSAMTATAGGSNVSVVVSASLGNLNGSRVAAAITPPLTPHHSTLQPAANLLPRSFTTTFANPTFTRQPTSSLQPTSSTAMALAAVAMAAAAALQHQQTLRPFPLNAVSGLATPHAAPTPSIPVPILHAQLYYPTTIPVNHVSNPCVHPHYASAIPNSQSQPSRYQSDGTALPVTSNFSTYWTQLVPLLLTVPATAPLPTDRPTPYAPNHQMPVGNAFAAVAAAAAAAAASVDTLYQLAVHLDSTNGSVADISLSRGLSVDELDSLPVRLYRTATEQADQTSQDSQGVDSTDDRCMICLDDYLAEDKLRQMRCHHEFHAACVDKWLQTKRTCPLCRADAYTGSQRKDSPM